jgi:gamma-glutamyltranspeptidase / glutathione hydrolase
MLRDVRPDLAALAGLASPTSLRKPLLATRGAVASSQPLAVQAGLAALRAGGTAVDAALATAITLTVVQPAHNGVGGDLFALVWDGTALHGLNASGRAPAALTPAAVHAAGHPAMPARGWLPVTVPGAPAGWRDLHDRFGRLPFADLFADAIGYAGQGYLVPPTSAHHWREAVAGHPSGPEFAGYGPVYAPGGRAPAVGERWSSPDLARSLRLIAETRAAAFYAGELAERIAAFAAATGGLLTGDDLAAHASTWDTPIGVDHRGVRVWELPPNGQGLAALLALNLYGGWVPSHEYHAADRYHRQIEAMKLALADAHRYVADPARAAVPVAELLAPGYADRRRALIGDRALLPEPGEPLRGGTVYLCAADADGMMVSLIQSNFMGFGSHVVVPGTGISLHDRGASFSLDPDHPNVVAPGKRPFHTIIPGFLSAGDGTPIGPFGVMGGHMQPQGHLQVVTNTVDYGMDPQAALDAPRWCWTTGLEVRVEPTVPAAVVDELRARGHRVIVEPRLDLFGCGQAIWRLPGGGYVAGSEPRTDGYATGW